MKKLLTKLCLLGVLCLVGSNARAENEIVTTLSFDDASSPTLTLDGQNSNRGTANYDFTLNGNTFLNVWGENNSNGSKIATITATDLVADDIEWTLEFDWAGYSGCNGKAGYTQIRDLSGNAIFSINDAAGWGNTFAMSVGGNISCYPCNSSTRISANTGSVLTAAYWHHITLVGNVSGIKLYIKDYNSDGTLKSTYSVDGAVVSYTNATPGSIALRPGSCGSVAVNNLSLSKETVELQSVDYTVKFRDTEGNELKADVVYNTGIVGQVYSASVADVTTFYSNDDSKKYVYKSGQNTSVVADADAANNVITLVFDTYNKYDYTVNAVDNSSAVITKITDGFCYADETAVVYLPKAVKGADGFYYTIEGPYDFTITQAGVNTKTYTKDETIAYFADFETLTRSGNFAVTDSKLANESNGGAARFAKNSYVYTPVFNEGGMYTLYTYSFGTNAKSTNLPLYLRDSEGNMIDMHKTTGNATANKWASQNVTNVCIPAGCSLALYNTDGSNNSNFLCDYIYLVKTGEATTSCNISAAGYATYVAPYALDFTNSDVTAYAVTPDLANNKVTLTSVGMVPAGKAIVVKGAEGTYSIPTIASADDFDTALEVSETATVYDTDYTYYYLGQDNGQVGFRPLAEGGSIAAGKCFFKISNTSGAAPRFFSMSIGEATAIKAVENATNNTIRYNLAGQRVNANVKGIVIVNGKKMLNK